MRIAGRITQLFLPSVLSGQTAIPRQKVSFRFHERFPFPPPPHKKSRQKAFFPPAICLPLCRVRAYRAGNEDFPGYAQLPALAPFSGPQPAPEEIAPSCSGIRHSFFSCPAWVFPPPGRQFLFYSSRPASSTGTSSAGISSAGTSCTGASSVTVSSAAPGAGFARKERLTHTSSPVSGCSTFTQP